MQRQRHRAGYRHGHLEEIDRGTVRNIDRSTEGQRQRHRERDRGMKN